jgi:hypothetical protein
MRWLIATAALLLNVGCSPDRDACRSADTRCVSDTTLQICTTGSNDPLAGGPRDWHSFGCAGTDRCVTATNGVSLCVDPTLFDPRCGTAVQAKICIRQDGWAECSSGYRVRTGSCDQCVEPTPGQAICVPPGSYADPVCSGQNGVQCKGNGILRDPLIDRTRFAA